MKSNLPYKFVSHTYRYITEYNPYRYRITCISMLWSSDTSNIYSLECIYFRMMDERRRITFRLMENEARVIFFSIFFIPDYIV